MDAEPVVRIKANRALQNGLPVQEADLAISTDLALRIRRICIHGVKYIGKVVWDVKSKRSKYRVVDITVIKGAIAKITCVIPVARRSISYKILDILDLDGALWHRCEWDDCLD